MNIERITLDCPSLDFAERFYGESLGMPVTRRSDLEIRVGRSILAFRETEVSAESCYHFAIDIPAGNVEDAARFVASKGPEVGSGEIHEFQSWEASAVYFNDPFGNIGEFIGRRRVPSPNFSSFYVSQVISLSELGLVTSDVQATVQAIQGLIPSAIPWESYDPEMFQAIGDDSGLMIVVRDSRPWFTTLVPARAFPSKISVSGYGGPAVDITDTRCTLTPGSGEYAS